MCYNKTSFTKGAVNLGQYFTNDENLKSELKKMTYNYKLYDFCFWTDNGVFSKDKIDYGSKLLLDVFFENTLGEINSILDVGCGYGFMGITISKILDKKVDMIDINKRAMHLAEKNVLENKVNAQIFESDAYENVTDKYDVIITNPPIRAGKEVLKKVLVGATKHLNDSGYLWFVMRKDHGAKSFEKILENHYEIDIVEKSKGFYIFKAKKR